MGLDNGIIVTIEDKQLPENCPVELDYFYEKEFKETGQLDVCYWRKCWSIRNEIISTLHLPNDCGCFPIELEDIQAIFRILKKYLHKDYWEENNDCIWEYDEMVDTILQQLLALTWLIKYKKTNPTVKVEFYDSY